MNLVNRDYYSRVGTFCLCCTFQCVHDCVVLHCRGNSKYHYYGIRIKPSSPLNQLSDHDSQVAMRQSPSTQKR